tara:strand:+ start:261 stop:437 length:177 start_codon:yes stop_codon:yes gene_type:complete
MQNEVSFLCVLPEWKWQHVDCAAATVAPKTHASWPAGEWLRIAFGHSVRVAQRLEQLR